MARTCLGWLEGRHNNVEDQSVEVDDSYLARTEMKCGWVDGEESEEKTGSVAWQKGKPTMKRSAARDQRKTAAQHLPSSDYMRFDRKPLALLPIKLPPLLPPPAHRPTIGMCWAKTGWRISDWRKFTMHHQQRFPLICSSSPKKWSILNLRITTVERDAIKVGCTYVHMAFMYL